MAGVEPEDGAEEDGDPGCPVPGAAGRGVEGEEEDAEPEDPGEDVADDHVVGSSVRSEDGHGGTDGDGRREQAEAGVHPSGETGQGAGEGDVAEGVAGEHLAAQHDEVPDQSAGHGDGRARQEGVAHEGVSEHVGDDHVAAVAPIIEPITQHSCVHRLQINSG